MLTSTKLVRVVSVLAACVLAPGLTTAVRAQTPAQPAQGTTAVPAEYQAAYEQGVVESAAGDFAKARSSFAKAHDVFPNAYSLRGLGRAELELGNTEKAVSLLEAALASQVHPLAPAARAETQDLLARARASAGTTAPVTQVAQPAASAPPSPPAPVSVAPPPPPPPPPPSVNAPAPESSGVDVAGGFRLSGLFPLEGYAEKTSGMSAGGTLWIEVDRSFVIEPQISLSFDVRDGSRGYFHLTPLELGAYFLAPFGRHALFAGPGVGMHLLFERVDVDRSFGSVIRTRTRDTIHDDVFGFGVFGRVGVVLFHGSSVSLAPSIDYAITFADFAQGGNEQALRANVALLFGGGSR